MKVSYGAQPSLLLQKLDLNSLDETERKKAVEQLKANVDEAASMGASRVAFLSGRDPGDADKPTALDALIRSALEVCGYALERGLALTCETFDRDIDKKCLIGPSDYALAFTQIVREDYPEFGLMCDLSHQPLLFEQIEQALALLKHVLVHVHVRNCVIDPHFPGYGDLHPRFGWPSGCNDVDELSEFLQALFTMGYFTDGRKEKPWVGLELRPQTPEEFPEYIIAGVKRAWSEAWSRMSLPLQHGSVI